jgi:hypothetical protein
MVQFLSAFLIILINSFDKLRTNGKGVEPVRGELAPQALPSVVEP